MKPAALTSSKVAATTGGLFQSPSVCVASRVFPRFHPGFKAATKADAEIGVKVPVHVFTLDVEAAEELFITGELVALFLMVVGGDELILTDVVRVVLVLTLDATAKDTALALFAVPVAHCQ